MHHHVHRSTLGSHAPYRVHPRSSKYGINNYTEILSRGHETNRILAAEDYSYKKSHNSSHSIKPIATV